MERKVIAIVLIASLVGLAGGYFLGYVIYQPQIQNLQKDLGNLEDKIETIENRTWHEVYSIAASSDIVTGSIHLKGSSVRVMWIAQSDYSSGWLSIMMQFSNSTPFAIWASSGKMTANNAVLELKEIGDYYLDIATYQTDFQISVWDYY